MKSSELHSRQLRSVPWPGKCCENSKLAGPQCTSTTVSGFHWQSKGIFSLESWANTNSVMFEHLFPLGGEKRAPLL